MTNIEVLIFSLLFISAAFCLYRGYIAVRSELFYRERVNELRVINQKLKDISINPARYVHYNGVPQGRTEYIASLEHRIREIIQEIDEYEMRGKEKV